MGFSRQEYWRGLPLRPPGNLPDPGIKPGSPVLQVDFLPSEPEQHAVFSYWVLSLCCDQEAGPPGGGVSPRRWGLPGEGWSFPRAVVLWGRSAAIFQTWPASLQLCPTHCDPTNVVHQAPLALALSLYKLGERL